MPRYLLPADRLMTGDRVLSATQERGTAIRQGPTPAASNVGSLQLWAEHAPPDVTPQALTLTMEAGGNPDGYLAGGPTAAAGCRMWWHLSTETISAARAWIDRPFVRYSDAAAPSSSVTAFGPPSSPVTTHDGRFGFVVYQDSTSDSLVWRYKSTRFADWTAVTITDNAVAAIQIKTATQRPGLLITDTGRLIAYAVTASPYSGASTDYIAAWYSDDHGATWAVLSDSVVEVLDVDLHAFWIGESAVMLQGLHAYVSASEGVSFAAAGNGSPPSYSRPTMVQRDGSVLVIADDGAGVTYAARLAPGGNIDNADDWQELTEIVSSQQRALAYDEQGGLWLMATTLDSVAATVAYYSDNGGASWVYATAESAAQVWGLDDSSAASTYTLESYAAGMMGADMVVLGRSNVASSGSAGASGQIQALYLGGWNVGWSEEQFGEAAGEPYGYHYWPISLPSNVGWTETTIGAGSNPKIQAGALSTVATASANSDFAAPANWLAAIGVVSGCRLRFVLELVSGGSVSDARSRVRVRFGGQWLEIRISSTQIAAVDNSGALATDTLFGGTTGIMIEFIVRLEKNAGTGGTTGLATVYYRAEAGGDTGDWSVLISEQDIADDGVSTGQDLRFGGSVAGVASMIWRWVALAADPDGIAAGSSSRGRALSNQAAMYLYSGLSVGGYGTSGVQGDTYDLDQIAAFPAQRVWDSPSPGEQAQSTDDTTTWRIVFDAGTINRFKPDSVMVFGTNWLTATVEANAANSWGSPSKSDALSTSIRVVPLDAPEVGGVSVDVTDMIPHEYASKPGARYFARFATSGTTYEIADNSASYLFIDADLSAEAGDVTIYMDRGWVSLSSYGTGGYRYMSIAVPAQDTVDGWFSLGVMLISAKVTLNAGDGSDAAWGWSRGTKTPVQIQSAADGYQAVQVIGGPRGVVVLPMLESMAAVRDWANEVQALVRYLDGPGSLVGLVIDSAVSHLHRNGGLYRLGAAESKVVNVYGQGQSTDRYRVDALTLTEVT